MTENNKKNFVEILIGESDNKRAKTIKFLLLSLALFVPIFVIASFLKIDEGITEAETVDIGDNFQMKICNLSLLAGNPREITLCINDVGGVPRSKITPRIMDMLALTGLTLLWQDSFNDWHTQRNFPVGNWQINESEKPPLEVKIHFDVTWFSNRTFANNNKFFVEFGTYRARATYGTTSLGIFSRVFFCLLIAPLIALNIRIFANRKLTEGDRFQDEEDTETFNEGDMTERGLVNQDITMETITEWNPASIAGQLRKLEDDPRIVKKFIQSIKTRFVINQDSKTQKARAEWLETQLAEMKVVNKIGNEVIEGKLKGKDFENQSLEKDLKNTKLKNQIADETDSEIRELEKKAKKSKLEAKVAKNTAKAKSYDKPEEKPVQKVSPQEKIRKDIEKLESDIEGLKQVRDGKINQATSETDKNRIYNLYFEQIQQKENRIAELQGQL